MLLSKFKKDCVDYGLIIDLIGFDYWFDLNGFLYWFDCLIVSKRLI